LNFPRKREKYQQLSPYLLGKITKKQNLLIKIQFAHPKRWNPLPERKRRREQDEPAKSCRLC
jgi:hypothetical protein